MDRDQFWMLIERAPDAVVVADETDAIALVNAQTERMFGRRRKDLLGKPVQTLIPERYREAHDRVRQSHGAAEGAPLRLLGTRNDGSSFPAEVSFGLAASDRGVLVFSIIRDVTDRERVEASLRRSEAYLAEAQGLTQTGSWAWDPSTGDMLHCSEQVFQIFGLDRVAGMPNLETLLQRVHPEDRERVRATVLEGSRPEQRRLIEYRIVLPDGTIKHIRSVRRPVLDTAGKVVEVVGASVDVTETRRMQDALRRSEAYLAEAQKLTRTGSWVYNLRQDAMLHCSEEVLRIYGLDPAEGLPSIPALLQRVHPEDRERAREGTVAGGREDKVHLLIYRIILPDGSVKYIESLRRPVLDEAGEVVEVIGTTIDVTERKRAEEERERLRALEAELAHVNRITMLGELAASLAHEIKQPIAAAVTNANASVRWLARRPPELEEALQAILRIKQDATRAADIIDGLRAFYRKESPRREPVDVNEVICEISALLRDAAIQRTKSIIHLALADGLPALEADRVQLQQILMNLLLNAVEATTETGGEVTVRSHKDSDGYIQVSVSDTGVGLPAETTGRIFEPFFTTKRHGTGMGLAITRSLVESHGGRVWAAPNAGAGATFSFTLPIPAH